MKEHSLNWFILNLESHGGQSSTAVPRPQGNVQDVGLNPAGARNENQTLGDPPPPQKVAQWSGQDRSGRPAM